MRHGKAGARSVLRGRSPLGPVWWGRRGFTRQPESPKRAHLSAPALQTPPKFNEKDQQEREEKNEFCGGRGQKKREILGPQSSGNHPSSLFLGLAHPRVLSGGPRTLTPGSIGSKKWPDVDWPVLRMGRITALSEARGWCSRHWPKCGDIRVRFGWWLEPVCDQTEVTPAKFWTAIAISVPVRVSCSKAGV